MAVGVLEAAGIGSDSHGRPTTGQASPKEHGAGTPFSTKSVRKSCVRPRSGLAPVRRSLALRWVARSSRGRAFGDEPARPGRSHHGTTSQAQRRGAHRRPRRPPRARPPRTSRSSSASASPPPPSASLHWRRLGRCAARPAAGSKASGRRTAGARCARPIPPPLLRRPTRPRPRKPWPSPARWRRPPRGREAKPHWGGSGAAPSGRWCATTSPPAPPTRSARRGRQGPRPLPGAISNALSAMAERGEVVLAADKPRRYRIAS